MKNLKFFLLIISISVNAQKGNGIALQQLRPTQPNYNYNYSYNPYLNNNKKGKWSTFLTVCKYSFFN